MLTIESLIAVLSFGLTCFELGYTLGHKSHKKYRVKETKIMTKKKTRTSILRYPASKG